MTSTAATASNINDTMVYIKGGMILAGEVPSGRPFRAEWERFDVEVHANGYLSRRSFKSREAAWLYLLATACMWSEIEGWHLIKVRKNGVESFNGGAWHPAVRKAIELAA